MYSETVDSATSNPSFSSSPWIRGAPMLTHLIGTFFVDYYSDHSGGLRSRTSSSGISSLLLLRRAPHRFQLSRSDRAVLERDK